MQRMDMPWYFTWLKRLFKLAEYVCPPLANYWAWRFFITPLKYPYPEGEKPYYESAKKIRLNYKGVDVQTYVWGDGDKKILVMHGWSSRATQFRFFIDGLTKSGYQVIGIDAPAHGKSDGKQTDLFDFAGVIKLTEQHYGGFYGIVAHSLGGVASIINVKNGLKVERLVVIASPAIAGDILKNFISRVKAFPSRGEYLRKRMKEKYKMDFEAVTASEVVKNFPNVKTLLVYDKNDYEAPWHHGEAIYNEVPDAEFLKTEGLGHTRILKDKTVIDKTITFLK